MGEPLFVNSVIGRDVAWVDGHTYRHEAVMYIIIRVSY